MVVRLWYGDIGRRGNVPNWVVREKLLDKFLVGGKPVPDRVFDVRGRGAVLEWRHQAVRVVFRLDTVCFGLIYVRSM